MKKKKLLIISLNQLPIDFWKQYINLKDVNYWHFNAVQDALNNVTTIWPDIIIVDGYFAKYSVELCIDNMIKKNIRAKIFCLTPNENLKTKFIPLCNNLVYSKLTVNIFREINTLINIEEKQKENSQIAS